MAEMHLLGLDNSVSAHDVVIERKSFLLKLSHAQKNIASKTFMNSD